MPEKNTRGSAPKGRISTTYQADGYGMSLINEIMDSVIRFVGNRRSCETEYAISV